MSKIYSFPELTEHSSSQDCWILIGGKVYDVTRFLEEHPGGDDVILSATAKDATDDFEDVGHSKTARDMMKDFCIGDIDHSSIPKSTTYRPPKQPPYNQDKSMEFFCQDLAVCYSSCNLGFGGWDAFLYKICCVVWSIML